MYRAIAKRACKEAWQQGYMHNLNYLWLLIINNTMKVSKMPHHLKKYNNNKMGITTLTW